MYHELLEIFIKYPLPGKVKTRLGSQIGDEKAAEVYRAFVSDLKNRLRNSSFHRVWFCDPAAPMCLYDEWLSPETTVMQVEKDLGQRMFEALKWGNEEKYNKTIIIGSDVPQIPIDYIVKAFAVLDERDVVTGPGDDGGFYLIGMKEPVDIFTGVPWSSRDTLKIMTERIEYLGLSHYLLPKVFDVDTSEDLERLRDYVNRHPGLEWELPDTVRTLKKYGEGGLL